MRTGWPPSVAHKQHFLQKVLRVNGTFSTRSLVELAEEFFINGGELLVVDEIHKYKAGTSDWSKEVKEIYELFPKLKMIVSGSSLLKLKEGDADLSRRAIKYTMPGLSFTLRLSGLLRICIGVASRLHPVFDDAGESFDIELLG